MGAESGNLSSPPGGINVRSARVWRDTLHQDFLSLETTAMREDDFWGQIDHRQYGHTRFALVRCAAHRVWRTARQAAASQPCLKALWLSHGHGEIEQGGQRATLRAGQWTVYETSRPYAIQFADGAQFTVALLPLEGRRDGALPGRHLCGQALTVDPAARGALFTVLSMFAAGATPGGAGMDGLLRALLLLVEESLCSQSQAGLPAERLQRRLAEARRLVRAQLGNPALGPKQLAQTLHMSLRSLYSLFDQMGMSPAAFIQTERLARCRAELADPLRQRLTITEIALANGFADSAHFSRLFKARFGETPSDWRQRATHKSASPDN